MPSPQLPTDTGMLVGAAWRATSVHSSRQNAEIERDRCNREVTIKPYTVCLVIEPVAERMPRPWR
jgi:hypothetical protein